nr:ribonuclease H-like domain-containing protein [Tanacetum cinerariifolium]
MDFEQSSSGPALNEMTPGTISSGLVRTSSPLTSYVPPLRNGWDLLFQPMFNELLNPSPSVVNQASEVIAPITQVIPQVDADSTSSPSSTTVDQDAPSPRKVCPLTKIAITTIVPLREPIPIVNSTDKPVVMLVYSRKPKAANKKVLVSNSTISKSLVVQIVLWYLDSGCSKHMTGHRSQLVNFIMGYRDYQIRNVIISRVYYVEGLARQGLVRGLPKLKFEKYHLCLAYTMGKCTKKTHKPKSKDTNKEKLYLLHMDLWGLMRFESINGKKYILIIVDDYSRFTWVKFLRSKDETPDFIIKFLKMIQVRLNAPVRHIRTDNGTEFVNQTLRDYYEESSSGPALNEMTPGTISSGLVRTSSPLTSYVPPLRKGWDLVFQLMFNELLNPPPSVVNQAPEVIAPITEVIPQVDANSTSSPSSTTVDQDAPSPSKSHATTEIQSFVIPQDVRDDNLVMDVTV